jgi:hypothetical protein
MAKRTTLEQWIREARADLEQEGPLRALQLVHKIGSTDEEVCTKRVGNMTDKDLADMFQAKAETNAQDLSGMQMYGLLAMYGENGTPSGRLPFAVRGKLDYSEEGNATEEPNERGKTQQGMRLLEIICQQAFGERKQLMQWMSNITEQTQRHNIELQRENREAFGIMKEVMFTEAKRQADNKLQLLAFERETAERQKWLKLLPAIANNVLGREIFPQGTEDTVLVESVIEKLDPSGDEFHKLAAVLPAEIMAPLAQRAQRYWKEQRELTAEAKRLAEAQGVTSDVEEARKELQ